jgi:hypothetical protein
MKYILISLIITLVGCTTKGRGVRNVLTAVVVFVPVDEDGCGGSSIEGETFLTLESCITEATYVYDDGTIKYGTYACIQKFLGYFHVDKKTFLWGEEQ